MSDYSMHLFLQPEDVWLFRDGRPFDAGTSHRARSVFPPFPTVTQGAIRSNQLVERDIDLRNSEAITSEVGTAEDFKDLRIRGPFVTKLVPDGTLIRYFPMPADAFPEDKNSMKMKALSPVDRSVKSSIITSGDDADLPMLLYPRDFNPGKKEYGEWLTENDLKLYLQGKAVSAIKSGELYQTESRVGIEQDFATKSTVTGMLYETEFIRPGKNIGLYLDVGGYSPWAQGNGMFRLGGENHSARYQNVNPLSWPSVYDPQNEYFKLYFATPAYFTNGWKPGDWSRFFDQPIELMAVAIRGYETIGGFDFAGGKDKPSRRFVPAGSVYFFKGSCAFKKLNGLDNPITEYGAQIGFGQVIVANWQPGGNNV